MKKVTPKNQVVRNYVITAASVITMSVLLADLFHSQARMAQQDRLNGYAPFIGAGVVNYGKDILEP